MTDQKRQTTEVITQLVNMQREHKREKELIKKKHNYDSDDSETEDEEGTEVSQMLINNSLLLGYFAYFGGV